MVALGPRGLEVRVLDLDEVPFETSYALTISSSGTGLPSSLQIFSYPIGDESLRCSRLKCGLVLRHRAEHPHRDRDEPEGDRPDQIERGIAPVFPTRTFA